MGEGDAASFFSSTLEGSLIHIYVARFQLRSFRSGFKEGLPSYLVHPRILGIYILCGLRNET